MFGKSQNKYGDYHKHTKKSYVLLYEAKIYVFASIQKTNFILWLFDLSQKLERQCCKYVLLKIPEPIQWTQNAWNQTAKRNQKVSSIHPNSVSDWIARYLLCENIEHLSTVFDYFCCFFLLFHLFFYFVHLISWQNGLWDVAMLDDSEIKLSITEIKRFSLLCFSYENPGEFGYSEPFFSLVALQKIPSDWMSTKTGSVPFQY